MHKNSALAISEVPCNQSSYCSQNVLEFEDIVPSNVLELMVPSVLESYRKHNLYTTFYFTQILTVPPAADLIIFCTLELFLINLP